MHQIKPNPWQVRISQVAIIAMATAFAFIGAGLIFAPIYAPIGGLAGPIGWLGATLCTSLIATPFIAKIALDRFV